jgi:hypothetical protein
METGFVYTVFDTTTQQYRETRYQTLETARAAAAGLNRSGEAPRYTVYPVSVFPIAY